ncbi:MAG: PfkB family carbohydrate kinase [Thermodesulfobacteriota bacterium]|nr:PfkB family carbohydrate kinase [Thermodesulfobacteriota bacterium]
MGKLHQDSLKAIRELRKSPGFQKGTVFVSGNFNIIHPGHLRLLRFASECGIQLVVGVLSDDIGNALLSEQLRLEGVNSINWVDYSFILRDPPENFIEVLKPDFVVKGKEHENKDNPELPVLESYGGKLLFSSGDVTFSSIDLLRDEVKRMKDSTITLPKNYAKRHNFSMETLYSKIEKIKDLNVLVVGDTIVDEYITCDPLGMSQEDPTIVVTPVFTKTFLGGAGIVAAHISGLGATVHFLSVTGKDDTAEFAKQQLSYNNVISYLYKDNSRPTIKKQRFRAHEKTLLRVNHLRHHLIHKDIQDKILKDLLKLIDNTHLVVFSDFNYGCLPQTLVDHVIEICLKHNVMMVADSQSSSQVGDISRFKNMSLVTPTEKEARLSVKDFNSGLVIVAEALRRQSLAKNILVTLGEEGLLIHAEISEKNDWLTDRIPALNSFVKDTAGAGDSLLACSAAAMAVGCDIWESAYFGSIAAACQVERTGNFPITIKVLENKYFKNL